MTHPASPIKVTDAERERVIAALRHIHATICPGGDYKPFPCILCRRSALGVHHALGVLDANPRDARGARRALHDAVCTSGCGTDTDHADRTQTRTAAALRKWHTSERIAS